ncbi:MAG: metal ABC transporter ATP-binding protein [Oscillibacter sp.]|nr:metal ABC transporter ATP-binding protein [Oscillibacter sp.]
MLQLICHNLTLGYDGQSVVRGLSFTVSEGDYLCIVGENGSGKSTLMKAVLGLLPPMEGTIAYGEGLSRGQIGYLPQQTLVQKDFPASVWEIVLSGFEGRRKFRPFHTAEEKAAARKNLERLGLAGFEKRCYRDLSGGQQQRVLLARALCATEKILVLDEPVTGLDPVVTAELYELISDLNQKYGVTIVMISHDLEAAVGRASHILHIGEDIFFGSRQAFLQSPCSRRLFREGGRA